MNRAIPPKLLKSLLWILLLLQVPLCIAAEGGFDTTFGNGGRRLVNVSASNVDTAERMVVRPDGKLLLAGQCQYTDHVTTTLTEETFCLTQLLADGSYDGNFGPSGLGYLQFDRFATWPKNTNLVDMIVLHDGRIALLGKSIDPDTHASTAMLLGILLADGTALDTTVGGGAGYLQLQFGGQITLATSMEQQPDGKLLLAGAMQGTSGNADFAVGRVLADLGGLDTSFGSGGWQSVAFDLGGPTGDDTDECEVVRLQSNGKIILAGYAITSPKGQPIDGLTMALVRLNTDGSRDTTFGPSGDGRLHYLAGQNIAVIHDIRIDAADRIVVGGAGSASVTATTSQWIIDRLSSNGGRDPAFNGGNPKTFSQPPGNAGYAGRLALTNDGIFAIGPTPRTSGSTTTFFAITRLTGDGSFDTQFGGGGQTYGSFTTTGDVDTTAIDIGVSKAGLMVFGTQTQTNGSGNNLNFGIGRMQYDHIFQDHFGTTTF